MAVVYSIKRRYLKKTYYKCMSLLKEGKGCAEVGRIMNIPRTTIKNWKYDYARPYAFKRKNFPKKELKIEIAKIISNSSSIPEISKKINCPYNTALITVKKYFPAHFERIKHKAHEMTEKQKKMTPELAYVLGVMFGDGYCSGSSQIRLGVIDRDFRDYFSLMVEKWLYIKPKLHEYKRRGRLYYEAHFHSTEVRNFIFNFLVKKKIPKEVMQSKNEKIKCMFIKGFFDSEGTISMLTKTARASNKNLSILKSIKRMLVDIGLNPKYVGVSRNIKRVHVLYVYRKNLKSFKEKIGFSINRKMDILKNI